MCVLLFPGLAFCSLSKVFPTTKYIVSPLRQAAWSHRRSASLRTPRSPAMRPSAAHRALPEPHATGAAATKRAAVPSNDVVAASAPPSNPLPKLFVVGTTLAEVGLWVCQAAVAGHLDFRR